MRQMRANRVSQRVPAAKRGRPVRISAPAVSRDAFRDRREGRNTLEYAECARGSRRKSQWARRADYSQTSNTRAVWGQVSNCERGSRPRQRTEHRVHPCPSRDAATARRAMWSAMTVFEHAPGCNKSVPHSYDMGSAQPTRAPRRAVVGYRVA